MKTFKFKDNKKIELIRLKIECDAIRLVSLSQIFVEDIFEEFTEEISRYMIPSPPKCISESAEFIAKSIDGMKSSNELVVAITSKRGEFLGCAGFHGRGKCSTPEFGVWLKKSEQGKGYGKMAIESLYKWAVENVEFEYAIYPVDVDNHASRRIPESLGGEVFNKTKVPKASGGFLNEVIYRVWA